MDALKSERVLREIILFVCAIAIFPFMTLRVLIWKWNWWIRKQERKIYNDHKEYQGL